LGYQQLMTESPLGCAIRRGQALSESSDLQIEY
jgi:hypothetical protein